MFRNVTILLLLSMTTLTVFAQVVSTGDAARRLKDLFEEDWQWRMRSYPESATLLGDHRFNDRLTDFSPEAIEERKKHERDMLDRIRKIDRSQLTGQDAISYSLFLLDKELAVEGQAFPQQLAPIHQMAGPQIEFAQLAGSTPFRNTNDYEMYLKRLAGFSNQIDQVIALMRRGIEIGWIPPGVPLRSLGPQIAGQIKSDPEHSPLFKPFSDFPAEVKESDRPRLKEAGRRAIADGVTPTLKKLHTFVVETYLPACREEIGASSLKDGKRYYDYSIRSHTTTGLTASQIHEIGKSEVARIRKEMESIIKQVKFTGSFQEFLTFLRTSPQFYYTRPADLVAGYALISKKADGMLPELFAELPRTPYGVKEIPDYERPAQTTAYYLAGAADGSRAGCYWVNTYKLETRPTYEMEALSLHEAVPGHHLQISRAQELKGLPEFRRNAGYTAYVEGWALYAESLGSEMGFYSDPYSKFGQLTYEMWRACRLVVDTGMHAMGWTRQQAIDFMKENTAKTENDIVVEVDRYIVWPGQALAYKLGELKIKELRGKAQRELGEKFDLRVFHNAVLDDGALPLEVLEARINEWIGARRQA